MNRKRFENAKKKIMDICYEQDRFNGNVRDFPPPSYGCLPDDIANKIKTFGNTLIDTKIVEVARELIEAADDVEFVDNEFVVKDPLESLIKCVKDIHFRKNGTVEIKYNNGTIGKVENVYCYKGDDNDD